MAKPLNLIGKRFGNLEVLERAENNKRGNTQWLCKCDCGKVVVVDGYGLAHGRNTTCGCAINKKGKISHNRKDIVGERYGRLVVTKLAEKRGKQGNLFYECQCDCGRTAIVGRTNLVSHHTESCGCLAKEKKQKRLKDLTGQRFGKLVVKGFYGYIDNKPKWDCVCDCGNTIVADGKSLKQGRRKSCGCLSGICFGENRRIAHTHSMSKTRLYREYNAMKNRCRPSYHGHKNYYDKGIGVCEEWQRFEPFCEWSLSNGYCDDLTLDRIDNSKGYSPDNCRWVDMKAQENNRSNNILITRNGQTKTLKQWCEVLELPYGTVKGRYRKGWSKERLFEPLNK